MRCSNSSPRYLAVVTTASFRRRISTRKLPWPAARLPGMFCRCCRGCPRWGTSRHEVEHRGDFAVMGVDLGEVADPVAVLDLVIWAELEQSGADSQTVTVWVHVVDSPRPRSIRDRRMNSDDSEHRPRYPRVRSGRRVGGRESQTEVVAVVAGAVLVAGAFPVSGMCVPSCSSGVPAGAGRGRWR